MDHAILSYFEGVLPEETHAALRSLQRGAHPVAFHTLVPAIEAALGRSVEELFESIDSSAVAAASIGQVHRALHHGRAVAVKIQYPDVRDTLASDFSRLGALAGLASMATAVDGAALVEELRSRMLEECDYVREADHQERFGRAFAGDPRIVIPRVVRERSASTVLTTEWCDGDDFYTFAERADPATRNAAAEVLAGFAYRSLFGLGAINADPHPGNYVFPDGDAVVFLDFGCVRRFEASYVDIERELARVVIAGPRERFRDAVMATGMVPKPEKLDFDAHWALLRHQYAPYIDSSFRFTFDYLREGLAHSKPDNPNLRHLAIPPPWIWQQRLQYGLHAVLARLGAEGDLRAVRIDGGLAGTRAVVGKALLGGSYMIDVWRGLRVVLEYHYSGFGIENVGRSAEILYDPAFQARFLRGDSQLLGRHALGLVLSSELTDDLAAAVSYFQSPADGSGTVATNFVWSQSDNLTLVLNVLVPWGSGPRGGVPTSEWGSAPISVFLQARVYD